jgi:hypothetical protein
MKFPLAYSFKTVSSLKPVLDASNAIVEIQKTVQHTHVSRTVATKTASFFRRPLSLHDIGIHRVLKPLRPFVTPVINMMAQVMRVFFRHVLCLLVYKL